MREDLSGPLLGFARLFLFGPQMDANESNKTLAVGGQPLIAHEIPPDFRVTGLLSRFRLVLDYVVLAAGLISFEGW
jgi:hypothetical protein